jgi:hypothetical protein
MIDVPERLEGVMDNNELISLAWYIAKVVRLHLTGGPCRDIKACFATRARWSRRPSHAALIVRIELSYKP